jgi:putative ABC transport system substrate-binding protein
LLANASEKFRNGQRSSLANHHEVTRLDRRSFAVAMASGLLAASFATDAQPPARMKRVGVLFQGSPLAGPDPAVAESFRAYGWAEGQNIEFHRRGTERPDELPALARELVAMRPDVVITFGTRAARAMQQATSTIPIFFNVGSDPVASGLVASLARPGGNLTGFCEGLYDGKMLQLVKDIRPRATLVIYPQASVARDVVASAQALGMVVRGIAVAGSEDLDHFFSQLQGAGADAVIIPPHPWLRSHMWQGIANRLIALKMPAIGPDRDFVKTGGLMSFGPKNSRRGVEPLDRLLRGANPADIPVELPTEFDFTINLKTAAVIGLTIPASVEVRADDVIRA